MPGAHLHYQFQYVRLPVCFLLQPDRRSRRAQRPDLGTYYTIHKIIAGLLDTHAQTGNPKALQIVAQMAAFFKKRIDTVIATKGWAWWEQCLRVEFGGMNEAMYNLYAITGNPDHKTMANYFYKAAFMDPLARGPDSLNTQHANTHLPEVIGVARGWELTGNATLHTITKSFYATLTSKYTYATGARGGRMSANVASFLSVRFRYARGLACECGRWE
jgi:DUF1680 family protein